MVEGKDWKLGRSAAEVAAAAATGQVRPDVRENDARRRTGADLMRGQAARGDVPLPGQKTLAPQPRSTGLPAAPTHTPTARPATPDKSPVMDLPDAAGHEVVDTHAATTPQPRVSSNSREMEQAVQAGKQALRALSELAQGGKNVVQNVLNKVATPQEMLQRALAYAQAKSLATPVKTVPTRTSEAASPEKAVAARAQAEEKSGAKQGEGAEIVATQVAQRSPSPFTTQPLGEAGAAGRKNDELKKIATNRESAKALAGVASGVQRVVTAAGGGEYSGGSHQGGFADQVVHNFKAMVSKAGGALNVLVYGDTKLYPETEMLFAKLGLSKVLYGAEELLNRAVPVDRRMTNTQDNTSLLSRVIGTDRDHKQMAEGGRGSPYGHGKMFG